MSNIGKEGISLVKKDNPGRLNPIVPKRIVFVHEIQSNQVGLSVVPINLLTLSTPADMLANGFAQPSLGELNGSMIGSSKKNLRLSSSLKGPLIQDRHYKVVDNFTLNLIGDMAAAVEAGEVLVGEIDSQVGDLVPTSVRNRVKTVTVPIGQRTVNLANEFAVNAYPNERVGSVVLTTRNGSILYRNTGNSQTNLDGDYYEVDSGNGYGTTVVLNSAPISVAYEIFADFGPYSVTNTDSIGLIQNLSGSIIKIARDLSQLVGGSQTDYTTANPSDIERRTFGDYVLSLLSRVTALEAKPSNVSGAYNTTADVLNFPNTSGSFVVKYTSKERDPYNLYNSTTGELTIDRDGVWEFNAQALLSASVSTTFWGIVIALPDGSSWYGNYFPANGTNIHSMVTKQATLKTGDKVLFRVQYAGGSAGNITVQASNFVTNFMSFKYLGPR